MCLEMRKTPRKLVHLSFNQKFPSINKTKALAVLLLLFSLFYSVRVWSKETMSERLVSHIKTALPPSPNTHTHTRQPHCRKNIFELFFGLSSKEKNPLKWVYVWCVICPWEIESCLSYFHLFLELPLLFFHPSRQTACLSVIIYRSDQISDHSCKWQLNWNCKKHHAWEL